MVSRLLPSASNQRGAILVIASVALLGVFVITGMVFDFGSWFVTRNQLQQIADTTALAGGRVLGTIYSGGNNPTPPLTLGRQLFADQKTYPQNSPDDTQIFNVLNAIANQHRAGGVPITIVASDVVVGTWDYSSGSNVFDGTPGILRPNAVRVTVRRDTTANGSLGTTFGRLLGVNSFSITATATAALTPINDVPPNDPGTPPVFIPAGQIEFPLGIDASYAGGNFCNPAPACNAGGVCIDLFSGVQAPQNCTAWNTFNGPVGNWGGIIAGNITSPQTTIGDMYNFGGDGSLVVPALSALYNALETPNPSPGGLRETLLPVYAANGCVPPAPGNLPIVGFVSATIFVLSGNNIFYLQFACNVVSTGRSGGLAAQDFGTFGSIPVLVQ